MQIGKNELRQILLGATLLGSGGGGLVKAGENFIEKISQLTDYIELITFPLSKEHTQLFACIICDIGSITAFDFELQDEALNFSYALLNDYFKSKGKPAIQAVFPIETGPENILAPFMLAAKQKLYVVDGDGAARAVPTLPLSTFSVWGVANPQPVSISNGEGDSMLVFTKKPEQLLRNISEIKSFKSSASLALWPDTVKELSKDCIPHTVSMAMWCGQLLQGINEKNADLIRDACAKVNTLSGYLIGVGEVIFKTQAEMGSFNYTTTKIQQADGSIITVISQNESLLAFSNQSLALIAVAPDSICYLSYDFTPFTNGEIEPIDERSAPRQKIYIVGVKANRRLKHPEIQKGFAHIIGELGYAGKMNGRSNSYRPLGELLIGLPKP